VGSPGQGPWPGARHDDALHYGDSGQVIVAERPQGSFARQLSLGEGVDSENLTAGYADGVLHVTIPASPKTWARRVEVIRTAGGSRIVPGSTVEPGEAPGGSTGRRRRLNVPVPCHRKLYRLSRLGKWPRWQHI
jgi:hypothetical protein